MKHAEVVFETGSKSVVAYNDEAELKDFVAEHQRRARAGEEGGPTGHPAERIHKVLLYPNHPGDLAGGSSVDASAVKALVEGMTGTDGKLNANQLIAALRDEMSPLYTVEQGRHASLFKAQEDGELDLSFLKDSDN